MAGREAIRMSLVSGLDRALGQHVQPQVDTEGEYRGNIAIENAAIDFEKTMPIVNIPLV